MSQAISFRRKGSNNDDEEGVGSFRMTGLAAELGVSVSPTPWRASPMSFKMHSSSLVGSLGKHFPPTGCSPSLGLDNIDFKMGSVSSSYDHHKLLQAISSSTTIEDSSNNNNNSSGNGTANYTCCGLPLSDLHALLDHFEESHVLVLDHHHPPPSATNTSAPSSALPTPVPTNNTGFEFPLPLLPSHQLHGGGGGDIEIDSDSSPLGSGSGSTSASVSVSSQTSSPSHIALNLSLNSNSNFNNYNPYYAALVSPTTASSDVSVSGVSSPIIPTMNMGGPSGLTAQFQHQQQQCITPASLFSRSGSPTNELPPGGTIAPSATTTTTTSGSSSSSSSNPSGSKSSPSSPKTKTGQTTTTTTATLSSLKASLTKLDVTKFKPPGSNPTTAAPGELDLSLSLGLGMEEEEYEIVSGPGVVHPGPPPPTQAPTSLSKPFKCPTANCNKSYKQANGLKYHMTHGQCCFLPSNPALEGLDEIEKDRVERPFGCGVGGCERRYKNMNGLRYHYQHSGAHGAVGLALLAAGTHSVQLAAQNASASQGKPPSKLGTSKPQHSQSPAPSSSKGPGSGSSSAVRPSPIATTPTRSGGGGGPKTPNATTPGAARPTFVSSPTSPRRSYAAATSQGLVSPTATTTVNAAAVNTNTSNAPPVPANPWFQHPHAQQAPGSSTAAYPYLSGYPYLPTQQHQQNVQGHIQQQLPPPHHPHPHAQNRGPVYPPNVQVNNAAVVAAYYAQIAAAANANAGVGQRPTHQLLRTNSGGAGGGMAVVGTSAVNANAQVGGGGGGEGAMDVDEKD